MDNRFDLHIYLHAVPDPAVEQKQDRIITMLLNQSQMLGIISQKEDAISAKESTMFESTIAKLQALVDADDAVNATLAGVRQALADFQAKSNLTAADQARFDALEATLAAETAKMVAAAATPSTQADAAPVIAALPPIPDSPPTGDPSAPPPPAPDAPVIP